MIFYTPKSANVFNLFGLFGKEELDSGLEQWISELCPVIKIDVTNKKVEQVKNFYEIKTTPFIILIDHNKASFSEMVDEGSVEKIKQAVKGGSKVITIQQNPQPQTQPQPAQGLSNNSSNPP